MNFKSVAKELLPRLGMVLACAVGLALSDIVGGGVHRGWGNEIAASLVSGVVIVCVWEILRGLWGLVRGEASSGDKN